MPSDWAWGPDLVGDVVLDVNGAAIGRVASVDVEHGDLEVALDERVARRLRAPRTLFVPLAEVVDGDAHAVTLREEGRFLAHPEERPRTQVPRV